MSVEQSPYRGAIFDLSGTLMGRLWSGNEYIITPRKDLLRGLEELRDHEINLGIVTTGSEENASLCLGRLGIEAFFQKSYLLGGNSRRTITVSNEQVDKRSGILWPRRIKKISELPKTEFRYLREKPYPDAVDYLLGLWDLKKEEVVFIGDETIDQRCADAAGVPFKRITSMVQDNTSFLEFVKKEILLNTNL